MGIRIAKGFNPREVLEKPLRLLAEQRFANMEDVGITVHDAVGFLYVSISASEGIQDVIEAGRPLVFRAP